MAQSSHTITLKFKGTDQVSAVIQKTSQGLSVMGQGLSSVSQRVGSATTSGSRFSSMLSGITSGLSLANNAFLNLSNGIRLVAQGLMSIGKGLTIFVTPLIFMGLKKAADVAIDFNAAMVRVQKTTQLTSDQIGILAMGIRDLAINTSTSQVDLANIAEQIGQLGVRSIPAILSLVDTFNMLTIATDISADEIGLAMGRIANAFGIDLNTEEGAEQIFRLSSVINELENQLAVTAPEILKGLENFAQVGSLLEIAPQTGAALVAALVSVGFGAEEAGTALRNMTIKLVENSDAIAQLMSNTERYATQQDVLNAINEDAARVLIDVANAASMSEDKAAALYALIDTGGIRGGKALAALAGSFENLQAALGYADDEWEEAISLVYEYEQALLSTENQMGVLRNNFSELALTIGDTLLPVINTLIEMAIPAVRRLTEAFRNLPPHVQKMIIVGALLLAVLGPILLFTSQLVFGLSMMAMGFSKIFGMIGAGITLFGKLGGVIGWVATSIAGLPAIGTAAVLALLTIGAALLMKFTGLGEKISAFFLNLADKARAWGANLIATYGNGILSAAAQILAKVLTAIGNFIGRFLAGHSPPDVGPLSHIDKWGQNVFDAYLSGFLNADFSILSQVGGMIEKVLGTLAKVSNIGEKEQFVFAMKARQDLAKLINIFNDTGQVAQDVLNDITANIGEAADEVQTLIRYWLEYNRIQQELAELEARREKTLDTYRQEIQLISQSNMSAEEKAESIREAMRTRDEELRTIKQEEDGLNKQKTVAEEQLEMQKQMIAAMQQQDDLQLRLLDTLDKMGKAMSSLADVEFPSLDGFGIDDDFEEDVEDALEPIITLQERIAMGEKAFDGFMQALMGADFDETLFAELEAFDEEAGTDFASTYQSLWEAGNKIYTIWEKIKGVWDSAKGIWDSLFGGGEGGGFQFEMPEGGILGMLGFDESTIEQMGIVWETLTGWFDDALGGLGEDLKAAWDTIWQAILDNPIVQWVSEKVGSALDWVGEHWSEIWQGIGIVIAFIAGIIVGFIEIIITVIIWLITKIAEGIGWLMTLPERIKEFREEFIAKLQEWATAAWDKIKEWAGNAYNTVSEWVSDVLTRIGEWVTEMRAKFEEIITKIGEILSPTALVGIARDFIQGFWNGLKEKIAEVIRWLEGQLQEILDKFATILGLGSPSRITREYGTWVIEGFAEGISGAAGMVEMSLADTLGVGLNVAQNFASQAATGFGAPAGNTPNLGEQAPTIQLNFGKDSVRSDRDIEDIAEAVERVLARRAQGNMSVGTTFGGEI